MKLIYIFVCLVLSGCHHAIFAPRLGDIFIPRSMKEFKAEVTFPYSPKDPVFLKNDFQVAHSRAILENAYSLVRSCEDANTEVIENLVDRLKPGEVIYSLGWYSFSNDRFSNEPTCLEREVGSRTKVRVIAKLGHRE